MLTRERDNMSETVSTKTTKTTKTSEQQSASTQAQETVKRYFDENASSDRTISAKQLATLCDRSDKVVRAMMRDMSVRASELKHSTYFVDEETALRVFVRSSNAKRVVRA